MNLFGREIPCGCDERREIMFTKGNLRPQHGIILIVCAGLLFAAWRVNHA